MKQRTAKWLRRGSLAVIAVLLLGVSLLAWLLGTASGARFAVGFLEDAVPLRVERVAGRLLGTLELGGISYAKDGVEVTVEAADISVAPGILWNFRRLTVTALDVRGVRLVLPESEPKAAQPPGDIIVPEMPRVSLPVSIDIVRFNLEDLQIRSAAERELLRVNSVALTGRWSGEQIEIDSLSVDTPQFAASAEGRVTLNPRLPVDLNLRWQVGETSVQGAAAGMLELAGTRDVYTVTHELEKPLIASTSGQLFAAAGEALTVDLATSVQQYQLLLAERDVTFSDAELIVTGSWLDWQLGLDSGVDVPELPAASLTLEARGKTLSAILDSAALELEDGTSLSANGSLDFSDQPGWDLQVTAERLPLALLAAQLTGQLDALMQVQGAWGDERRVAVDLRRVNGTLRGAAFNAGGSVEWRPGSIDVTALQVAVGDNEIFVDGRIEDEQQLEMSFRARARNLAELLPELDGNLSIDGQVSGTRSAPVAAGRLATDGLVWRDVSLGEANADVNLDGDRVELNLQAATLTRGALSAAQVEFGVSGTLDAHRATLRASLSDERPVNLSMAGRFAEGIWSGELLSLTAAVPLPGGAQQTSEIELLAPTDISIAAGAYRAERFCLRTTLTREFCASFALDQNGLDVDANITGVSVASLVPVTATGVRWSGEASLDLSLQGTLEQPDGTVNVTFADLLASKDEGDSVTTLALSNPSLLLTLASGAVDLAGGAQLPDGGRLSLQLALGDLREVDASVSGRVSLETEDLSSLNVLLDTFQIDEGRLLASIGVSGTRSQPVFDSELNVTGLQARVVPLGILLEDVSLNAINSGSDMLRFTGAGRSGEGRFDIRGSTRIDAQRRLTTTATVTADALTVIDLPDRFAVASVDVNIVADNQQLSVDGNLTVDRADITVRGLPEGAVAVSRDERIVDAPGYVAAGSEPVVQRRLIDVTVALSDDVSLKGFGLSTELAGQLRLRQRADTGLQGFGKLNLVDAIYKAYGQTLTVSRGTLVFNGPLDGPLLDFRAERSVDSTLVGIDIRGTPDDLQSSLFSTPALPEAEIFSLLLTGRSLSSAGQTEGSAMADAAITLGLRQAFGVSSAIRDVVGLDTLTVEGSGRGGRVLAGKQLSPNLYLQYAYGVFDQLSTVLLRLRLNERLSLETTTGDNQSVDLIYSVGRR